MLHLLNRAVLLDTASVDRQVQIKDLLLANGYEVYVKAMTYQPLPAAASQLGKKFGEHKSECIYRIYVRRSKLAIIMSLIKKHNL